MSAKQEHESIEAYAERILGDHLKYIRRLKSGVYAAYSDAPYFEMAPTIDQAIHLLYLTLKQNKKI